MTKKIKFIIVILVLASSSFVLFNTSLGRYILNNINNHILESRHFYFNSSILKINNTTYSVSDWDGINPYQLTIDLSGKKNELVSTEVDISYDIAYSCPATVICSLSKSSGIVYATNKTDSYVLTVTPISAFTVGQSVTVNTSVTSSSPYTKTLTASYNISVQNYGFSYNIKDTANDKYLTVDLTNSRPYYKVVTSFDTYQVGDLISLNTYNSLSPTNKAKCASARVRINFDPTLLRLDLTSEWYANRYSQTTTTLSGYTYVNSLTFDMDASMSASIIFYKVTPSGNYSNNSSAISVTLLN